MTPCRPSSPSAAAARPKGSSLNDRRWKKTLKIVQDTAYLAGETSTTPEDLLVLSHALWREPKEYSAARETAGRVTALRTTDRKNYVAQAAQALGEFQAQQEKLKAWRARAARVLARSRP